MYYISNIKQDLIDYNNMVNQGENYNGTTTKWAEVIEHKDGGQFAILKNSKYIDTDLTEVENLDGWYNEEIL